MTPILSILTPSIWSRIGQARKLSEEINRQIETCGLPPAAVEHLVLFDNRSMSIGEKRQALFDSARGTYAAFCDDDDWIFDGYVGSLVNASRSGADVITFKQDAHVDDAKAEIVFRIGQPDEPFSDGATVRRGPWHVCAWRRELVASCRFPHTNYGEDASWSQQARRLVSRGAHINNVLHCYRHDSRKTAAPHPG